jgi:hypothetical protein
MMNNVASDAQWHTFGVLLQPTSGGQGTFAFYLDNVLHGSIAVGTGTSYPLIFNNHRVFLLGKNWGNGTNPINCDWVRYWSA